MSDQLTQYEQTVTSIKSVLRRAARCGIVAEVATFLRAPGESGAVARDLVLGEVVRSPHQWPAASINKLAVAIWLVREHPAGASRHYLWDESDRRAGGGRFDQPGAPCDASTRDLLFDMLSRSSNTAMAVLGRRYVASINSELKSCGVNETRLMPVGVDGRFETGFTTPADALQMLELVLEGPESDQMTGTARYALSQGQTFLELSDVNGHWSKRGELNGSDNYGEFVRHEAGVIEGDDGYCVGYAAFTSYRGGPVMGRVRTTLAKQLIAQTGGMLAESVGSRVPLRSRLTPFATI